VKPLAVALRLVRIASRLVPKWRRGEWEREWRAELQHHALEERDASPDALDVIARSTGAVADAAYVRGQSMQLDLWWNDLRFAWRNVVRRPGFTLLVVLTLALGIGVNSAVFALIDAVLLRPLPYRQPDRLVFVWQTLPEVPELEPTPADYTALHAARSFQSLALVAVDHFTLTGDQEPERVRGARCSASLFGVLGIAPRLGRAFVGGEDAADAPPAVIVSDGLWRRRLGADPAVIGRSIRVDGVPHTIVGVMPSSARLPGPLAGSDDLWLPLRMTAAERTNDVSHNYTVLARLADRVSPPAASAEMQTWAADLANAQPATHAHLGAHVVPIVEDTVRSIRPALLVLMGGVGLLLLIASANVSTLLLARASSRTRDVAIRSALGAGAGRLASLAVTESVVLAALGALAGLALGGWVLRALLPAFAESLPEVGSVDVDARVATLTMVVALVLGVVFGLVVMLQGPHGGVARALKSGARGTAAPGSARTRHALVIAQVAFSVMLLAAAGLMVRSFVRLRHVQPGFAADHLLTFRLALPEGGYASAASRRGFVDDLLTRLSTSRGVVTAAVNSRLPLGGSRGANGIAIEGRPPARGELLIADEREVTPEYFGALRIPLLAGRAFTDRDTASVEPVTIVNHAMAQRFWPNGDALNQRVRVTAGPKAAIGWTRVIGIIGDVRHTGLARPPVPEMYRPYAQTPTFDFAVVVRTTGEPSSMTPTVRAHVQQIDQTLPVYDVRTMEDRIAGSFADRRATALLLLVTAALAALLASIAIYGSIWYSVSQRLPEIGIRLALGATPASVCRRVLGHAVALTIAGAALGTAATLAAAPILRGLLFDTPTTDPSTYSAVVGGVIVLTVAASIIPARRAMSVDPLVALRAE
jgi:putative ABC transport system permease protein